MDTTKCYTEISTGKYLGKFISEESYFPEGAGHGGTITYTFRKGVRTIEVGGISTGNTQYFRKTNCRAVKTTTARGGTRRIRRNKRKMSRRRLYF